MLVIFVYLMFEVKCMRHACKNDKVNGNFNLNNILLVRGYILLLLLFLLGLQQIVYTV